MYHKWNLTFRISFISVYILRLPLCWLYGYYPMHSFYRSGVDIPSNIMRQWAKWMLHPKCFVDDKGQMLTDGYNSIKCPILALHFADDEHFHQSSKIQTWHLSKGGHFNFFKEKQSKHIWKDVVQFLKYDDTNLSNINK